MSSPDSLSFVQSKQIIGTGVSENIQMAPDGKIYIDDVSSYWLSVINNPSMGGLGCNYQRDVIHLTNMHNDCLPQFLQKYKVYIHDSGECQDNPVHFSGDIWPPPTAFTGILAIPHQVQLKLFKSSNSHYIHILQLETTPLNYL